MVSQTYWSLSLVIICALQISVNITKANKPPYNGDLLISRLPGQPRVGFKQYSGYIPVDEKHNRLLFFYFVEAENDPASKPVVLWLNGGPGCSSVGVGAFTENGPFQPTGNKLVKNKYSWNLEANMIYLDSPAGVGFSYSGDPSFYKSVNDNMTAKDNFIFLKNWFKIFQQYKNNELYITGESYAGHYAPQLAILILQSKPPKLNLKGIAMGNPLLEFATDFNGVSEYMWSHGMISDNTFDQLNRVCNYSNIRRLNDKTINPTPECSRVKELVLSETSKYIDTFDVTLDVCLHTTSIQSQSQMQNDPKVDVCVVEEAKAYLSRKDVQSALHARVVGMEKWTICSSVMHYNMKNLEIPMIGLLGSLVKQGIRVLAYSGDQDSVIPLTGTRKLIDGLATDLKLKTTQPYSVWLVENQVGGWTQGYGNLTFASLRGASHDAAFSQPKRSLDLFRSFIAGKPLPPAPAPAPAYSSIESSGI
ncbi:hypothetical protein CASFOL_019417 [Castilleja foliolosa]|uniref:Carboxypeptidase n=1 Tax=Castilleja foliolosa TaxID=1961234 RepID=A0ABD3D4B2_9LAMI